MCSTGQTHRNSARRIANHQQAKTLSPVGSAIKKIIHKLTTVRQNKPLTWRIKEVKSKFHSNKIMLITDFGDIDKARDWGEKIEAEARQTDRPTNTPDF